jgi:hypothetical protein
LRNHLGFARSRGGNDLDVRAAVFHRTKRFPLQLRSLIHSFDDALVVPTSSQTNVLFVRSILEIKIRPIWGKVL